MPPVNSIKTRRVLTEVEGYLRLLTDFPEQQESEDPHRVAVAERALECLDQINEDGGESLESDYLRGSLLRAVCRYEEAIAVYNANLKRYPSLRWHSARPWSGTPCC